MVISRKNTEKKTQNKNDVKLKKFTWWEYWDISVISLLLFKILITMVTKLQILHFSLIRRLVLSPAEHGVIILLLLPLVAVRLWLSGRRVHTHTHISFVNFGVKFLFWMKRKLTAGTFVPLEQLWWLLFFKFHTNCHTMFVMAVKLELILKWTLIHIIKWIFGENFKIKKKKESLNSQGKWTHKWTSQSLKLRNNNNNNNNNKIVSFHFFSLSLLCGQVFFYQFS